MAKNFLSINANYNDFISIQSSEINKFLLENQEPVLSKVYGFFQKNENLLLITGFFGTGKYQITRHMMNYIDKEVLALKFECSQASTLDDLLLNFWYQLLNINPDNEHLLKYNQNQSFQEKLTDFLAELTKRVLENKDVILITLGGETSYKCCRAIGASQLQLIDEVAPAIALSLDHEAHWIVTKSGNLGGVNTLIDILNYFENHE